MTWIWKVSRMGKWYLNHYLHLVSHSVHLLLLLGLLAQSMCLGLMWPLFLLGHLNFSDILQVYWLRLDATKGMS